MPVVASCQCGAKFAAQDHLAGKTVRCPKCSQPMQIPTASAATQVELPPPPPPPSAGVQTRAKQAAHAPASVGGMLDEIGVTHVSGVRCPQCSVDTRPDAVICVNCGYNLQKGRQLKVQSDAALAKKRAALDAQKAKTAERNLRKTERLKSAGSGDAQDLGGVTEGATAILIYPTETFQRLSTIASTRSAFEFAFISAFFICLFWITYLSLYFFAAPLAALATKPEQTKEIVDKLMNVMMPLYWELLRVFFINYAVGCIVQFCVVLPAMAAVAHLVLKFVGESKLEYTATLRVLLYTSGAALVLSGIPCIQIFAPLTWLVTTGIGLTVHHRVSPGAAMLALAAAIAVGLLTAGIAYLLLGVIVAAFVYLSALLESTP